MLLTYMKVSGTEIANGDRFQAHMRKLGGGVNVHDCGCDTITYDDPGPYDLPQTTGALAPWYDSSRPESAHFAGVLITQVLGLDSPYAPREVVPSMIGGSLGGLRLGPRELVVTCTLFGLSSIGLDYGLSWLTAMLSGRHCNATTFCNLGDIEMFIGCPEVAQGSNCVPPIGANADNTVPTIDETTLDLRRTMFGGGLVNGPTVTNRMSRGREVVAYEVTFTLATESPYMSGTETSVLAKTDLDTIAAVTAEVYTCPAFVDPCAGLATAGGPQTACVSYVEDTCDWNNAYKQGPASWSTQTWTATGEEVINADGDCSTMTLTRTGNAAIDGCTRPSVRMLFSDATGGNGPLSVEFTNTAEQGNINFQLWDPASGDNIPITSFQRPSGSGGSIFSTPTGDAYNIGGSADLGRHVLNFSTSVDPGTLYLIISAFGGGFPGFPEDESITNIKMTYQGTAAAACCSLEPGDPIVTPTFSVPCYTAPATAHRQVVSVVNADLSLEQGMHFTFTNPDVTSAVQNLRVAIYDTTLIGGTGTELPPTAAGAWSLGGVEEWECTALVHEFFVPEIPTATTIEIDGRKRQTLRYPLSTPEEARSGSRFVYGGATKPWFYNTVPPCTTYAVAVFADGSNTPALSSVTLTAAPLHLVDGAAR